MDTQIYVLYEIYSVIGKDKETYEWYATKT